ncbi:YqjF family protein [Cellulomonas sp. URHB0016]
MDPLSPTAPPLDGRVVLTQDWVRLSFLHWRVDPSLVVPLLPAGTHPDLYDGTSWVGLIAFRVERFAILPGPPLPYIGTFPEINVRLYSVDDDGRRGVVFRSLEATRLLTVLGARAATNVPYEWARMSVRRTGDAIDYRSTRLTGTHPSTRIVVRPTREPVVGDPLADFLTARWGAHTSILGRTRYVPVEHQPWPLRRAELVTLDDELVAAGGLPGVTSRPPDSVLYSPGVHARFAMPHTAVH